MAEHTPGPWEVSDTSIVTEKYCVAVIEDDGEYEAPRAEQKANARLIAAAPDLLAACDAAEKALRSYQYGNSSTDLAEEIADHLKAVLAKATGKDTPT